MRRTTCTWMPRLNSNPAPGQHRRPQTLQSLQDDRSAPESLPLSSHRVREIELHEVKMLNKHLVRLRDEFGLRAEVLLPREVTGDDPPHGLSSTATARRIHSWTCERWSPRCARSVKKG